MVTLKYYPERPVGITVVAAALALANLVNIVISFIAMVSRPDDGFLKALSATDAAHGVFWANILLSLPLFVFIAGLFGEGAWARAALISYLFCNLAIVSISFFSSPSYPWIAMLCDSAIIVYMAGDEVGAAYARQSGKGWGVASGFGLVGAQLISLLLILHLA